MLNSTAADLAMCAPFNDNDGAGSASNISIGSMGILTKIVSYRSQTDPKQA